MKILEGQTRDVLVAGTVLWRPIRVSTKDGVKPYDVLFDLTDRGNYMGKVNPGEFIDEFELCQGATTAYQKSRGCFKTCGIVSFMETEPDPEWTHFVVTKNCMKPDGGGVLFVKEMPKIPMYEYLQFRSSCYRSYATEDSHYNLETKVKQAVRNIGKLVVPGRTVAMMDVLSERGIVPVKHGYRFVRLDELGEVKS